MAVEITLNMSVDAPFFATLANFVGPWNVAPHVDDPTKQIFHAVDRDLVSLEGAYNAYPSVYFAHRQKLFLEDIAEQRRVNELKGPQGLKLDDKTAIRLIGAVRYLERHPEKLSYSWEVSRGNFVDLPRDTIIKLSDLAVEHVADSFEHARILTNLVREITPPIEADYEDLDRALSELVAINIKTGWPQA